MMFILDTDMLSLLHDGHIGVQSHRDHYDRDEVVTTVITRLEILRGRIDFVLKAADGTQTLRVIAWLIRSEELLTQIEVVPFDANASTEFDRLRENKKIRRIGRA